MAVAMGIHEAAREGNVSVISSLLDTGDAALGSKLDEDGRTPLHWAAAGGHIEAMRTLLQLGADRVDIEHRDESGWTALMSATSAGHVEAVAILLQAAPNSKTLADQRNNQGQQALHFHKGREEMARILLPVTTDVNAQDKYGATALHRCCRGDCTVGSATAEALITAGAVATAADCNGNTALHLACELRAADLASALLRSVVAGTAADSDAEAAGKSAMTTNNGEGKSPLDFCTEEQSAALHQQLQLSLQLQRRQQ